MEFKPYKGYNCQYYKLNGKVKYRDLYQVVKPRPYDEADYYTAKSYDGKYWKIIYECKEVGTFIGKFEDVVDYLEEKNSGIKPKRAIN